MVNPPYVFCHVTRACNGIQMFHKRDKIWLKCLTIEWNIAKKKNTHTHNSSRRQITDIYKTRRNICQTYTKHVEIYPERLQILKLLTLPGLLYSLQDKRIWFTYKILYNFYDHSSSRLFIFYSSLNNSRHKEAFKIEYRPGLIHPKINFNFK